MCLRNRPHMSVGKKKDEKKNVCLSEQKICVSEEKNEHFLHTEKESVTLLSTYSESVPEMYRKYSDES